MRLQTASFDFANKARSGFVEFTTAHENLEYKFLVTCKLSKNGRNSKAEFWTNKSPSVTGALRLLNRTILPNP